MCQRLEQKTQVNISRSRMGRVTQKLNLTPKKTLHASEKYTQRVQKLRAEYCTTISSVNLEDGVQVSLEQKTRLSLKVLSCKVFIEGCSN